MRSRGTCRVEPADVQPAVFLDRDGTLIVDVGYMSRIDDLRWYPYAVDVLRLLRRAGYLIFVITNQGGVALGYYDEAFVRDTHARMGAWLDAQGAHVDGWFYCPHHPRGITEALRADCECRKPKAGMVREAQKQFDIDLSRSFVVGDKVGDVGLARTIGGTPVLVRTGHGDDERRRFPERVGDAHVAIDLMEATTWILGRTTSAKVHA